MNNLNYVPTNILIAYLELLGKSIIAPDFIGFAFKLPKKFQTLMLVSLNGQFRLVSVKKNSKLLSRRKTTKILKWLLKNNFIRYAGYDPFPEFELYSNMQIMNPHRCVVLDYNIFKDQSGGIDVKEGF